MSTPVRRSLPLLLALALLAGCGGKEDRGAAGTSGAGTSAGGGDGASTPYASPYAGGGAGSTALHLPVDLQKQVDAALARGRENLLATQGEEGAWGDEGTGVPPNVGYTALAATALIAATPSAQVPGDAAIARALDYVVAHQNDDGAIFDNPAYVNYMTSAAIGALAAAKIARYADAMVRARDFVAKTQIAADASDVSYGGFPYKQDQGQPSDLSNAQFAASALHDAGLPADDPVWKRLVTYLTRIQNRSESSDLRVETKIPTADGEVEGTVVAGDDEGAGYGPAMSKAGFVQRSDGTWEARSYGSMTYALLKCLLLAGVDAKDPRVAGAVGWLSRNFAVDRNPGFETAADPGKAGQQGYYYYVFTMARALAEYERVTGEPLEVKDADGQTHAWRAELATALLARRGADGWWVNEQADRWEEGARILATSYALQALAEISGRFR